MQSRAACCHGKDECSSVKIMKRPSLHIAHKDKSPTLWLKTHLQTLPVVHYENPQLTRNVFINKLINNTTLAWEHSILNSNPGRFVYIKVRKEREHPVLKSGLLTKEPLIWVLTCYSSFSYLFLVFSTFARIDHSTQNQREVSQCHSQAALSTRLQKQVWWHILLPGRDGNSCMMTRRNIGACLFTLVVATCVPLDACSKQDHSKELCRPPNRRSHGGAPLHGWDVLLSLPYSTKTQNWKHTQLVLLFLLLCNTLWNKELCQRELGY